MFVVLAVEVCTLCDPDHLSYNYAPRHEKSIKLEETLELNAKQLRIITQRVQLHCLNLCICIRNNNNKSN